MLYDWLSPRLTPFASAELLLIGREASRKTAFTASTVIYNVSSNCVYRTGGGGGGVTFTSYAPLSSVHSGPLSYALSVLLWDHCDLSSYS